MRDRCSVGIGPLTIAESSREAASIEINGIHSSRGSAKFSTMSARDASKCGYLKMELSSAKRGASCHHGPAEARLCGAQFELRQRELYANGTVQLQNHAFPVLQQHAAGPGRKRTPAPIRL